MTLDELASLFTAPAEGGKLDIEKIISSLRAGRQIPEVAVFKKQYKPSGHDTMDVTKRPDKDVMKPDPLDATKTVAGKVKVNRLALSLQKIITSRAVSFLFGNPVKITNETEGEKAKQVLTALTKIMFDNKMNSFNRRVAREMFRSTEVAECWFPVVKETHTDYGFQTTLKLRVSVFSPWDGNELFPLFDETGDMIAFSRAYERQESESKKIKYFETYTDSLSIIWADSGSGWEEKSNTKNTIGKIPVVFGRQEEVEWADVQSAIERLEYLLSNFADTNDYHGAPKIFVEGNIIGFATKGESGGMIQGDKGSKASYLSWNHATDSIKLEIETLLRFIYSFTQTPDISFESVKGLNEISGEALKMLFLDAHLKVQDKREVFDEYLQRRINIIKSFIGQMSTALKDEVSKVQIEADIQPFMINDLAAMIDRLMTANGNKAIISRRTAIAQSGLVDDVEKEVKEIEAEETRTRSFNILEPTS